MRTIQSRRIIIICMILIWICLGGFMCPNCPECINLIVKESNRVWVADPRCYPDNPNYINAILREIKELQQRREIQRGTVFIPPGIHIVDSTIVLQSNISLVGAGIGVTILKTKQCFEEAIIENESNDKCSENAIDSDSNITISASTIDGKCCCEDHELYGIFMVGHNVSAAPSIKNLIIQNIQIFNIKTQGIVINGENVIIENIEVRNTNKDGIQVNGNKIHLSNITGSHCGDNAVEICFARDASITNCTFRNNNRGLLIRSSTNVAVSNCVSTNNSTDGYWIWATDSSEICSGILIHGCISDANNQVGIKVFPEKRGKLYNVSLIGNTVSNNGMSIHIISEGKSLKETTSSIKTQLPPGNTWKEHKLRTWFLPIIENVLVEANLCFDNYFNTCDTNAAVLVSNAKYVTVTGNKCYDTRTPKYQIYGFREIGTISDSNWVCMNDFRNCEKGCKKENADNHTKFCKTKWYDESTTEIPPD